MTDRSFKTFAQPQWIVGLPLTVYGLAVVAQLFIA